MSEAILITIIMIGGMFILMAIGVSVAVSIALPSAVCLLILIGPEVGFAVSAQKVINGVDNFALLCIPLFILAGAIMNQGGIAQRLIDFARALTGRMPGALAQTSVVANVMFGAISGSALAGASAVGSVMSPVQKRDGYPMGWAAATNIASAPAGMLIPPSNVMIVYSMVSQVSVGALFMAGYIPGFIWAASCMVVAGVWARKHPELKGRGFPPIKEGLKIFWRALPSLMLLVIVMGGIVGGIFTPTEGSGVAVAYALILSFVYRTLTVSALPKILLDATRMSAVVIFLIGLSTIMSHAMTMADIPDLIGRWMISITDSKIMFLLIMAIVLLIIGIPLDPTPAVLIFTPIFLPIAVQYYGIDPVHFGIMMVFNMCIAVISPPSAPVLFVGARTAGQRVEDVMKPLMPYFIVLIVMLLVIQFVPELSLWLPKVFGLMH